MKLKHFEAQLQQVAGFAAPKIALEQCGAALVLAVGGCSPRHRYLTTPHIAAQWLYAAQHTHNDIFEKVVLDLGCGSGMLSVGAALLDADLVVGVDIDADALQLAQANVRGSTDCAARTSRSLTSPPPEFELECQVDLVQMDVHQWLASALHTPLRVDTVLLNPPFGTRRAAADISFLATAIALVARRGGVVYSLHKSSTRAHVLKQARQCGGEPAVMAELRYNLDKSCACEAAGPRRAKAAPRL